MRERKKYYGIYIINLNNFNTGMIKNKGNIYTNCTLVTDLRDISILLNTICLQRFFFWGGG